MNLAFKLSFTFGLLLGFFSLGRCLVVLIVGDVEDQSYVPHVVIAEWSVSVSDEWVCNVEAPFMYHHAALFKRFSSCGSSIRRRKDTTTNDLTTNQKHLLLFYGLNPQGLGLLRGGADTHVSTVGEFKSTNQVVNQSSRQSINQGISGEI